MERLLEPRNSMRGFLQLDAISPSVGPGFAGILDASDPRRVRAP